MIKKFVLSESGAVTVDWVVLTAASVGLGLASVAAVRTGSGSLADAISASLSGASVMALDGLNRMGFGDGNFLGWSTNRTGFSEALGTFLGPFAGHEDAVTHDVILPDGATEATISFDLLLLDSWDGTGAVHSDVNSGGRGDGIAFSINGTEIGYSSMTNGSAGTPSGTFEMDGTTYSYELTQASSGAYFSPPDGGGHWSDAVWNVTVTADNPPPGGFQFGVNGTSNQGITDESFGIDNYVISSD